MHKNFLTNKGPFSLADLAGSIKAAIYQNCLKLDNIAPLIMVHDINSLKESTSQDLTFFSNSKYLGQYHKTKALACITSERFLSQAPENLFVLVSNNPYADYARITSLFYLSKSFQPGISNDAFINPTATIGKNCEIGHNVTIGANVKIGNNTKIYPGVYIDDQVTIGNKCIIHHSVTISNSIIGEHVLIHPGAKIGQDGFGYAFENYQHIKVPQIGGVIIGNHVEIGANCTIDRGAIGNTIIEDMCKIDNLVQIGHNVKLCKGCIIVSQVGISGSTTLGEFTIVGGQAGLAGHLAIGNGVQIAAQSGVIKDIEDKQTVGGYPALPIRQWHRQTVLLKTLIKDHK